MEDVFQKYLPAAREKMLMLVMNFIHQNNDFNNFFDLRDKKLLI